MVGNEGGFRAAGAGGGRQGAGGGRGRLSLRRAAIAAVQTWKLLPELWDEPRALVSPEVIGITAPPWILANQPMESSRYVGLLQV